MERPQNNLTCRNFCTYFAVFVIIVVLGRDIPCTCKPQVFDCNLYFILPIFIIFVFILWTDQTFQRVCRHLCLSVCGGRNICCFFGSLVRQFVRAAIISTLWIIYVFLDGNWYICCMNDYSAQQAQLACKSEGSITDKDRVLIAELKNKSRLIGTFLLFGIIGVPALLSTLEWKRPSSQDRKKLYYQLILEQEQNVLKEILRQSARERLTAEMKNKIREEHWEQCFDVAEELIKESAEPTTSERAQGAGDQD